MTTQNEASNSPLPAETIEENDIAAVTARGTLPNPKGAGKSVTDSGRIKFGGAFRLPTTK